MQDFVRETGGKDIDNPMPYKSKIYQVTYIARLYMTPCQVMTWFTWYQAVTGILEFAEAYPHVNTGFFIYTQQSNEVLAIGSIGSI